MALISFNRNRGKGESKGESDGSSNSNTKTNNGNGERVSLRRSNSHQHALASQEPRLSFTETSVESIPDDYNMKITLDRSIQKELKKKPKAKERSFSNRFFGSKEELAPEETTANPTSSPPTQRTASMNSAEDATEAILGNSQRKRVTFANTARCVGKARRPTKGYNPWYTVEDFMAISQSAQWMAGVLALECHETRQHDPRARVHLLQALHEASLKSIVNTNQDDTYSNRLSLMTMAEMSEYRSLYDTHSDLPDTTLLGMEGFLCSDFHAAKAWRRRHQLDLIRQIQVLAAQVGTPLETVVTVMARECSKTSLPGRLMARHTALALARCKEVKFY